MSVVGAVIGNVSHKSDIHTRPASLDFTMEKEFPFGFKQSKNERHTWSKFLLMLDLITGIQFSIRLNFVLRIENSSLKFVELSVVLWHRQRAYQKSLNINSLLTLYSKKFGAQMLKI